ncbi:hypothetical protein [Streptomyces sp. NPDC006334]|uniref:hypothetical protein n=1 Tax=Streptomyces sp. NPDC006334 TaxID=3156754 RepID=UPI0033A0F97A
MTGVDEQLYEDETDVMEALFGEGEQGQGGGVLVHLRQDREQGARSWLLLSAQDIDVARQEWNRAGVALLRCGALFAAVRIDADLVHAAAGTSDDGEVNEYLAAVLAGPVFRSQHRGRYYALVPASAAARREWRERRYAPHAECLGLGSYVGVPRPDLDRPDRHISYWCVPMSGPGDLCDAGAVSQLLGYGRHVMAMAGVLGARK